MKSRFIQIIFAVIFMVPGDLLAQHRLVPARRPLLGFGSRLNTFRISPFFGFSRLDGNNEARLENDLRLWGIYWAAQNYFAQPLYTTGLDGITPQPIPVPTSDSGRDLPVVSLPEVDESKL